MKLLSLVKHKNLVALVGYCEETTGEYIKTVMIKEKRY